MRRPPLPLWCSAAIFHAFLYAPIAVVIVLSFNSAKRGTSWEGFPWEWYRALANNEAALAAAKNTLILGHVTFQIPFLTLVIRSRLAGSDPALEEAAHDLGANAWRTFRHVTLPMMAPGVAAAAMLAFTLSLDDFAVSFFTNGPGSTTLPILIYSSVKRSITPDINAQSTLIVVASVLGTVLVFLWQRPLAGSREEK